MKPKVHMDGTPVPINEIKIPLNPTPWLQRWERMDMKGIIDCNSMVNEKRRIKAGYPMHKKPWEKYDLMKIYRYIKI
jgi:large subunit ribosomal protein L19